MAEDVEGVQEKPSNTCCAALKKKHSKLLEKYAKLEEIKNRFRDCTALVQQKYDVIEKENENLKKALEELKVQANVWKDEKEKESDIRIELEDEVSALKEEVQLLRQKGDSASQGSNQQLQECLSEAEKEIKQLTELLDKEKERAAVDKKNAELEKKKANEALKKVEMEKSKVEKEIKQLTELLDKERGRAALEKKNAELEKRKANEALKKVELEKNKASDVQKVADANQQLQERLNVAEKEIKQLRDLLDKERGRAALEKKNAELEKKKANEALKKVELEKNKASDVQKVANANQQLQERLNMAEKEIKQLTELLEKERGRAALEKKNAELEKKKANEALKKVELKKKKVSEVQKVANVERKKAEENRLSWEKLKMEIDQVKSMLALERSNSEAAKKKVEAEKHKVIAERKRADLALAEAEEQRELAETNLKKSTFEKDRADDLNRKLEEARIRAGKLAEFHEHLCTGKLVEGQAEESNTGRNAELASDFSLAMLKNDTQLLQWMEKMPLEKEHNILREKKLADSEKKKAKKQRKVAEAYKTVAVEQKHRADQLSREVESYKLRVEELQDLQELVSYRKYANDGPLRNSNVISETDTVKLLKKQLELEKMLVKHAKKTSKVEAIRNNMLHQELCHLKQECFQLQKRLDILDENFLNGTEAINQLEKICNQTSTRETLCSDGYHRQLISGIDSRLDPPYRGSTQKMLQSSAINSSSASFSDRPLVGSQERGTFSVTKSAELGEGVSKLEPTMSKLPDKMRIRYNEHFVAKVNNSTRSPNNSTRSPIKENAKERRVGYRERKRILDAVDSIESLYSKGEKLHQRVTEKLSLLHGILNGQKDEPPAENLKEDCCKKLVRPFKRRKTLCQGTTVIHLRQDSGEPKSMLDSDVDHSDTVMHASPPESDIVKFDHHFKVGTNNTHGSKQFTPQDFDEMAAYDYMKLLDLDDAAYESSYRRAIAMPLSPTLPEVYFDGDELESDNPEMLVNRSSQERVPSIKDDLGPASSFHITDTEKSPTNLVLNGLVSSQMQTKEDSVIFLRNMDPVPASDTCFHEVHVSGRKMGIPDLSPSGNEESNTQCEKGFAHSTGDHLKYFVVSSENKDNSSILRIFQAICSCMPQCSFLQSAEIFLRSILHALLKAKDLSMKEKVCVFFSVTLHGISEVGTNNSADVLGDDLVQSLDSVTLHFCSALSDPALRKIFMESCHLFELLAVVEDFLLQRKVWFCGDVSAELEALHSSKINLVLNGNAMMLSQVVASPHLMVAGGNLLASVCSAVDHIGFVCEMSCNIITMQKFDPVVMLAVLHVFAHVCGSKYFNDKQYSVAMTVVKSVVMFLEKRTLSTNSTSFSPSIVANPSKIWLCSTNCPFSVGALSLEDVALLLLENLQKHDRSGSLSQDSLELVKSLVPTVWSHEETTEEVSGLSEAAPFVSTYDENLCAVDILSLVDILATVVSWDWTFDHIIGPMCEYLESHLMEGFSAAAVVLLGQLGRLGVCASGYDDSGIKKLRGWLSSFVPQITFMKLSLPVQLAIINALFSLTPIKFEEIIDEKAETPAVASQSIPASSIRAWFSLLSHEQQSLFRLHQAASDSNSEIGVPSRQMF